MNQLIISLNEPFDRENPSRNRLPVANVLPVTLPISILLRGRKNVKHSRVLSRWKSGLAISYLFSRSFDNFRKYLRISRHRFFDTRQKVSEPNSFHQRGNDDVVEAKSKAMNNQQETVYWHACKGARRMISFDDYAWWLPYYSNWFPISSISRNDKLGIMARIFLEYIRNRGSRLVMVNYQGETVVGKVPEHQIEWLLIKRGLSIVPDARLFNEILTACLSGRLIARVVDRWNRHSSRVRTLMNGARRKFWERPGFSSLVTSFSRNGCTIFSRTRVTNCIWNWRFCRVRFLPWKLLFQFRSV